MERANEQKTAISSETLVYIKPLPPEPPATEIKKLAPSLAGSIAELAGITECEAERLIRDNGVFGAIENGALSGFVWCSPSGEIYEPYIKERFKSGNTARALLSFITMYVMTFGNTPFINNAHDRIKTVLLDLGYENAHK